ncbi:hypothetical protein AAE02nite_42120 [Adhaeribacter aerolatus]|uniref:Uncharacterized protein n=1 Tax=Adhaeribacter aerolatus TaxID=670289 RepID=A0A512B3L2_9BACT|nr:hypothetical protein [Adhaeribacter aerolatus]GEO06548.1 hypothetical protein AAE02nite_42120 [Adhaeribacter aerolatus]
MKLAKDENRAEDWSSGSILYRLMEQYVAYKNKLQEEQAALRRIYKSRPSSDFFQLEQNKAAYLMALSYYKEELMQCLRKITAIEQDIVDTKKTISEFVPVRDQPFTINFEGEDYITGFVKRNADIYQFILVKKSLSDRSTKPTYLPTCLPTRA